MDPRIDFYFPPEATDKCIVVDFAYDDSSPFGPSWKVQFRTGNEISAVEMLRFLEDVSEARFKQKPHSHHNLKNIQVS